MKIFYTQMGAYGGFGAESSWSVAEGNLAPWEAIFIMSGVLVDTENHGGRVVMTCLA